MIINSCLEYVKAKQFIQFNIYNHESELVGALVCIDKQDYATVTFGYKQYTIRPNDTLTVLMDNDVSIYERYLITYDKHPHCNVLKVKHLSHCQ